MFDKSIISSYRFFILFFLNFPETIKDQMTSFYSINPQFISSFSYQLFIFISNAFLIIFGLFLLPLLIIYKRRRVLLFLKSYGRKFLFVFTWFLITLTPIIFVPSHISPHQGTIALFGFLILLFLPLDFIWPQLKNSAIYMLLIIFICSFWIYSSSINIYLNEKIHWIRRRSDISEMYMKKIEKLKPWIKPNATIIIGNNDKDTIVALSNEFGLKEYLNQENIKVFYASASADRSLIRLK